MDLERLKSESLKLGWRERLQLAQHLLESLHQEGPLPAPGRRSIALPNPDQVPELSGKKIVLDGSVSVSFQRLRAALESSLDT